MEQTTKTVFQVGPRHEDLALVSHNSVDIDTK